MAWMVMVRADIESDSDSADTVTVRQNSGANSRDIRTKSLGIVEAGLRDRAQRDSVHTTL
jgi:hypothetical protein